MSTDLVRLTEAARALAAIKTPSDAAGVIRYAELARVFARQAELGTEAENAATAIRLKAEIRLAEAIAAGQQRGEIADRTAPVANVRDADIAPATLTELGISRQRLAEARSIAAAMGPAQIDALVEHANEQGQTLSRAAVLREVKTSQPVVHAPAEMVVTDRMRERHPEQSAALDAADRRARLARAINEFTKGLAALQLTDFADDLDALDATQIDNIRRCVRLAGKWTDEWATAVKPRRLHLVEGAAQ